MELWVRSQDKRTLIQPNRIDIDDNAIIVWQNNYNCDETYLGTYKTKERALEVLDEIQRLLMPIMKSTPIIEEDIKPEYTYRHYESKGSDIEVIQLNTYVYQMPKE